MARDDGSSTRMHVAIAGGGKASEGAAQNGRTNAPFRIAGISPCGDGTV